MRRSLVIIMVLVAAVALAQSWPSHNDIPAMSGSLFGWNNTLKRWLPIAVSSSGELVTTIGAASSSASVSPYTVLETNTYVLTPNVSFSIPAMTGRKTIEIGINTSGAEAWFSTSQSGASIGQNSRRFYSSVSMDVSDGVPCSVISSTAIQICVMQAK